MSDAPSLRYLQNIWLKNVSGEGTVQELALEPNSRFEVYERAYWLRLIESLEEDYPRLIEALHKITGDSGFEELAKSYLTQYPPHAYSLSQIGATLSQFLTETLPWSEHKELADHARLDWLEFRAWNAPYIEPVSVSSLNIWANASEEKLERLTLEFQPGMALFCAKSDIKPSLALIYRNEQEIFTEHIGPEEFSLLNLALEGATLKEIATQLSNPDHLEAQAIEWAADWMSRGLVTGLTLKPNKGNSS